MVSYVPSIAISTGVKNKTFSHDLEPMKEVEIKAISSLFGTVSFIRLKVPEDTRVMATAYGSDVTKYKKGGDVAYVTFGESYHVIASPHYALDMKIVIRPGERELRPLIRVEETGSIELGGHPGRYFSGKGLFLGRKRKHLVTVHYCDQTDRTIQITFKGPRNLDMLELIRKLEVICHEME